MTNDDVTLNRATPIFSVQDLPQALEWYQQILGFEIAWTWGNPTTRASVCRDEVEVNLAAVDNGGKSAAYFEVTGVTAYHDQIVRAGGRIAASIGDRPYGMRDFSVLDPAGNELSFGEAIVS